MAKTRKVSKLQKVVKESVDRYLKEVDGYELGDLFSLVSNEVEKALLIRLNEHTLGNQSQMSRILGLSRITLRRKLQTHGIA